MADVLDHFTDLDDELAVGSHPHAPEHVVALATHGVKAVVCLQSDDDLRSRGVQWTYMWQFYLRSGIAVTRVPVIDFDRADLARHLDAAVEAVVTHHREGRKVFVHCNAGVNRSPSVVIGFLMRSRGYSLETATAWVADRHMCMPYGDVMTAWAERHGYALREPV